MLKLGIFAFVFLQESTDHLLRPCGYVTCCQPLTQAASIQSQLQVHYKHLFQHGAIFNLTL